MKEEEKKAEKTGGKPNEILARRMGMSLEEFEKTFLHAGSGTSPDRLGMSVEEFRNITLKDGAD